MIRNCAFSSLSLLVFSLARVCEAQVAVQLVPDNPGPYAGGEAITVDFWLHSSLPGEDPRLAMMQFDFSQTNPNLTLGPTFTFDYSSIADASYYNERHPGLPVPWTWNQVDCICPQWFLPLPPGGAVHIGSIGVVLPTAQGVYRLDSLNAAKPAPEVGIAGAIILPHLCCEWMTAFGGQITGGDFDFVVPPPIPTMSGTALLVLAVLLGIVGSWIAARRSRSTVDGFSQN